MTDRPVRDPNHPCTQFDTDGSHTPSSEYRTCYGDGHYRCRECKRFMGVCTRCFWPLDKCSCDGTNDLEGDIGTRATLPPADDGDNVYWHGVGYWMDLFGVDRGTAERMAKKRRG